MIFRVIINILLCLYMFFETMFKYNPNSMINYGVLVSLICISISLYIFCNLYKNINREKILFANILYLTIVSLFFNKMMVLWLPVVMEYMKSKKYRDLYIIITIILGVIIQINIGVSYSLVCLSVLSTMCIYENIKYENKINTLEKANYDLIEKIYFIEDMRKSEYKLNLQNVESIKINERNIISQKIHDDIGHTLAGSIMQLEALKVVISKDLNKGIAMVDSIAENLRKGMDDIRYTLRTIKPEQSQLGINQLKFLLDEFSKDYNINTNLHLEGDLSEINILYWKVIIDTVKEVLTNTIKHSNGDFINCNISVLNKIIRVHIKDNGSYYNAIKKGMGLLGMEERIVNVSGSIEFDNEDGFSTLIILNR